MCGRYKNHLDPKKLVVRYGATNRNFTFTASPEFAPTMMAPVVVVQDGKCVLKSMKWGLIPSWAKDPKIGSKCFNARAETVEEKPAFRNAFKTRRCLVPADSFFEWRTETEMRRITRDEHKHFRVEELELPTGKNIKVKYQFSVAGSSVFSLAGLWSTWKSQGCEPVETFTILTTEPNELMAEYHNRMPVILPKEKEQFWIDPAFTNPVLLKGLLKPFPPELMVVESLKDSWVLTRPVKP